jgi:hypothetical protein
MRTGAKARWIAVLVLGLTAIQIATLVGPLPPTLPAMCATILVLYTVFALVARWVERRAQNAAPNRT